MFHSVTEILEELKAGRMVVVMDDEGRENEGDLLMAAQFITPEAINFMARYARGLICIPMEAERLDALGLHAMKDATCDTHQPCNTGWAISVDAAHNITTGISAADRAYTARLLIDPKATPKDFVTPGHLFPLRAKKGGVLVRAGHTEASVDLMHLAGLYPAGVICEIMNEDGTMGRTEDLLVFAKKHGIKICTIDSLIEYRRKTENFIQCESAVSLPTQYGNFQMKVYSSRIDGLNHIALLKEPLKTEAPVLVRVQSECLTGDVLGL